MLGGTWLTALAGDMGNGIFDGANLVANFESLNPANTYWGKAYNVYSKVDTEAAALPRLRDLVGQPGAAQCRRDAVDRRQPVRRQQAHRGRDPHVRRRARRPAQHQVADHRVLLVGRQHHAAAAGAGLDHRPLRPRGRDRRQRPDHRLHAAPDDRPSRHLRLGQGGDQGACRVRLVHGDDRPDAARPLRGGDHEVDEDTEHRDLIHGKYLFRLEARTLDDIRALGANSDEDDQRFAAVGAPVRDQPRPLPHARPAGGAGDDDRAIGRDDAADASQPPALRHVLRQEPDDAAGEGAGRGRARGAQAGRARQSAARARAGRLDLDHDLAGKATGRRATP